MRFPALRQVADASDRPQPSFYPPAGAQLREDDVEAHFQFDFGIPTLQRPSASLFIGVQALSGRTEANTQWVKKKTSRFSSPSTDF